MEIATAISSYRSEYIVKRVSKSAIRSSTEVWEYKGNACLAAATALFTSAMAPNEMVATNSSVAGFSTAKSLAQIGSTHSPST